MRKWRCLACVLTAILCTLFLTFTALASPKHNIPVTVVQPDGTQIHCFISGDETFNYYHDADGNLMIQDPDTGFFTYAKLSSGQIKASSNIVPATGIAPEDLSGLIQPSDLRDYRPDSPKAFPATDPDRPGTNGITPSALTEGTLNNLVIFLRFSDEAEFVTGNQSTYLQGLFNAPARSMKSYLSALSNGELTAPSTFYPRTTGGTVYSYQAANPRGYYMPYNAVTNPIGCMDATQMWLRGYDLLEAAIDSVKGGIPSSLNVDRNGDGYVDNICFVVNGQPGAWATFLWPHMSSLPQGNAINGKEVGTYNLQLAYFLAQDIQGESDLCHEMLHTLGFPDLYRYSYDGDPMGRWDVMDYNTNPPQYADTYLRSAYGGWVGPSQYQTITANGRYTLYPVTSTTGTIAYKIPLDMSPGQYIVVEYRNTGTGVYDSTIPGSGLIVYRVDESVQPVGNMEGPPDEVFLFRPGENGPGMGNGDVNQAFLSAQSGRTAFGSSDVSDTAYVPGSIYYQSGLNTGIVISNVSTAGATISFNLSINKAPVGGTGKGSGTAVDPYIIHGAAELNMMRGYLRTGWTLSKHYRLGADIDLSDYGPWKPISTYIDPFTGTLDGAGHTISGMTMTSTEGSQYLGLFGCIGVGGVVRNLNLAGCGVNTDSSNNSVASALAGGIVGWNQGDIINCTVQGKIQGANYVGGIAGMNGRQDVDASVSPTPPRLAKRDGAGETGDPAHDAQPRQQAPSLAAVQVVHGRISGCYADVELKGERVFIGVGYGGGISGSNEICGQITGCSVNAQIQAVDGAGGITAANGGSIADSFAGGSITTTYNGGSIVGVWWGGQASRCLGAIDIQDTGDCWGYRWEDSECPYLYYDTQLCGKGDLGMNTPRTTAQLTSGVLPEGLSGTKWEAKPGFYPRVKLSVSIPRVDSLPVYWGTNPTLRTVGSDFSLPARTWEGKPVSWSNSNSAVLILSGTTVRKGGTGNSELTVSIAQGGGMTARKRFRVSVRMPVQKITLNPSSVVMKVGDTVQLHATISPAGADQRVAFVYNGMAVNLQGSGPDRTIQLYGRIYEPLVIRAVAMDGSGISTQCTIRTPPVITNTKLTSDASLMIGTGDKLAIAAIVIVHSPSTVKLHIRDSSGKDVAVTSTSVQGYLTWDFYWDGKATVGNQAGLPAGSYVPASPSGIGYTARLSIQNAEGSATSDTLPFQVLCPERCTVRFDSQGGSAVPPRTVPPNTTITAPPAPQRTGYIFAGWYKEAQCKNAWNFASNKVATHMTLYAKWTPLATPASPKATATSYNSVLVTWSAVSGAGGYQVWRSTGSGYTLAATTAATSHTSAGLSTGSTYYYKVRAYRTVNGVRHYSAYTAAVSAKPTLTAATGLKATATTYNSVKLTWTATAGAGGYEVWRSTKATSGYTLATTVAGTSSTNAGLATGTTYYYKARAYRTVNGTKVYGGYSAVVSAKPSLSTPTGVKAVRLSATSIKVSWAAVAGAMKYEVWRASSSGGTYYKLPDTTTPSYTNTGLTTGKTYYYKVRAYRMVNGVKVYGGYSAVVFAKP